MSSCHSDFPHIVDPSIVKTGSFWTLKCPAWATIFQSQARTDFACAWSDATTLIKIHDDKTKKKVGKPIAELEALKRSAVILAVTAWESFVEDTVSQQLTKKLASSERPDTLSSTFNYVAAEWMDPIRSPKRFGPALTDWTGDNWKERIKDSLIERLKNFNTPNSENTNELFDRYLGIAIKNHWSWQATSPDSAQNKLNALIKLRGRAVHRGKVLHPMSQPDPAMRRGAAIDALNLVFRLVQSTEEAINEAPTCRHFSAK